MIISSFNRYFEKHGRKTYIALGIIISVIFVFALGDGMESCGSRMNGLSSYGTMYGKKLNATKMQREMAKADVSYMLRTGRSLSGQVSSSDLELTLALQRMRALRKAKELGLANVTDAELIEEIKSQMLFGGKEHFSKDIVNNFIEGYLAPNHLTGSDLDEIIKENLIISRLEKMVIEGIVVADDEINEYLESFSVSQMNIPMDVRSSVTPSDEEIQKFFETRKGEIALEPLRSAVVLTASIEKILAIDDAAAAAKKGGKPVLMVPEPSEQEITSTYEAGRQSLFKDKKLEEVRGQIRTMLRRRQASDLARKVMDAQLAKMEQAPAGEAADAALSRFRTLGSQVTSIVETGFFSASDMIPGLEGRQPTLARAIRSLEKVGDMTKVVATPGTYSIAMLKEVKANPLPAELTDEVREKIIGKIIDERAMAFFNEKILPYKDRVAGLRSIWDLMEAYIAELQAKNLGEEEMNTEYQQFQEFLSDYLYPFFKEEVRSAKVVAFKPAAFADRVTIEESDLQSEYAARKAEFEKKQVRMTQIVVNLDDTMDDAAKAAKKAKLTAVLDALKNGKEFSELVLENSEASNVKETKGDTGLLDVAMLEPELANTVLAMDINQVSGIIENKTSMMLVQLKEKDMGRQYADASVQEELKAAVTASKTKALAADAAFALSSRFTEAQNENDSKADKKTTVQLFDEMVSSGIADAEILDVTNVNQYASFPQFGREPKLLDALFSRTADKPCTYLVAGDNASFIACMTDMTPSSLTVPTPADVEPFNRLKSLYRRDKAMAAAAVAAEAKAADINKALEAGQDLAAAAGKDSLFEAVAAPVDAMTIQGSRELLPTDRRSLLSALHKGKVGSVLAPMKANMGYALVYLAKRELKTDEQSKAMGERIKAAMLQQKQSKKLMDYYKQLEVESNTMLVEGLINKK